MQKVGNFTPHDIHVYDKTGTNEIKMYSRDGREIRLSEFNVSTDLEIDGIKVVSKQYETADEFPDGYDVYIVSQLVAQACVHDKERIIIYPDTGSESVVRNDKGVIIGVRRFATFK